MSVTLTSATPETVVLPNPINPATVKNRQRFNTTFRTDSGTRYVYSKGVTEDSWEFSFYLSSSELSDLRTFFDDVDGMTDTFTMNDHDGNDHTVRFSADTLRVSQDHSGYRVVLGFIG